MPISFGGLVSGLDSESLIEALMEVERKRVYTQEDKQAALEKKQTAWRNIRTSLTTIQSKMDVLRTPAIFQSRKVTLSDESVASITAASGAAQTSYTLEVVQLAQSHVITQGTGPYLSSTDQLNWVGAFQVGNDTSNLKTVTVEATDTLGTLAAKINKQASGVTAHVVTVSDTEYRLVLTSSKSGEAHQITLQGEQAGEGADPAQGSLLEGLLGLQGTRMKTLSAGQDAIIKLNEQTYQSATNAFDNILPGITITAKKPSTGVVSATVTNDTDKVVQAVKDWVSAVNSLQDQLKSLTSYDSEKKTSGVLNGESLVRSMQHYLRKPFSTAVEGLPEGMNLLSHVGISYGAYGSSDYGKIVVDEQKLTEVLVRDPEGAAKLFYLDVDALKDESGDEIAPAQKGLAVQMNDYISSLLDSETGAIENRDKSLADQIRSIGDTIGRIELQLEQREESLRRQFNAMEAALSKLQSQGNYINQMLAVNQNDDK